MTPDFLTRVLLSALIGATVLASGLALAEGNDPTQLEPLDCVINPSVVADLGSGVPGILNNVAVDRSDMVEAGDIVAELESSVEVAALDLAQARAAMDAEVDLRRVNAAFGQRQQKRTEDLYQRKAISTNDMDERNTEARLARIQLRQARDNKRLAQLEHNRAQQVLQRRTIKSPISGVVMERFKTVGEYVEDQPVVRIAQLDPLHVEVFVPVEHLGKIRPGMQAQVWSETVDQTRWRARVSRVDRVADVASGTYGVRLELPNPDYRVPAGLRCQLEFVKGAEVALAQGHAAPEGRPVQVDDQADKARLASAAADAPTHAVADAKASTGAETAAAKVAAPKRDDVVGPRPAKVAAQAEPTPAAAGEQAAVVASTGSKNDPVGAMQKTASAEPPPAVDDREQPTPAEQPAVAAVESVDLPLCHLVGPFDSEGQARAEARLMRANGFEVDIERQVLTVQVGHKIATKPLKDFATAQQTVKQLQEAGFTDYYLPQRRKTSPRIYLGLYHDAKVAEKRIRWLERRGFEAELLPWKDSVPEFYLLARKASGGDTETDALPPAGRTACEQFASR